MGPTNAEKNTIDLSMMSDDELRLYLAVYDGRADIVRGLLAAGVDKDKVAHDGITPLYIAAQNGDFEVVRALLDAGADKDKVTKDGETPLYVTLMYGHREVVRALSLSR